MFNPDRGFGFLHQDSGGVIFFHISALSGIDPADLAGGDQLEYEVGTARKVAANVRRAE